MKIKSKMLSALGKVRKNFKKAEGFNLSVLWMSAISVVVLVVVVSIGARILTGLQNGTNATTETVAYNLIGSGLNGLAEYGNWFVLIVLVVVGVVLIRLLLAGFAGISEGGE